jgi:heme-degrading monooxygenase HmoA
MNRSKSLLTSFYAVLFIITTIPAYTQSDPQPQRRSVNPKYEIASAEYEELSEKYLQHIANFEWEDSYALLSDDVEFKLPDGDSGTRTSYKGLDNVKRFWNNYMEKSGNDKLVLKDFVHIPVQVNQKLPYIEVTGVFDLCYFSAELSYGAEKTNVRMHWAFHFDDAKKIDGIYTYYDRTPIIETAKKNFLSPDDRLEEQSEEMVVQIIKIKSELSEEELLKVARERALKFKAIPGLLQKYYVKLSRPGEYGGIYVWDSKESMRAFKESDLAAGIPQAYSVVEGPDIEILEMLFQLRE